MNLKHDFDFNPKDPFKNDKLQREEEAITLTNLVKSYADGFVLAINNEWGAGKTTFLKMWQAHLKLQGVDSLYFNAWENDHQTDVMVALLSELKELEDEEKEAFDKVVENAVPIAGSIVMGAFKGLAATFGLGKVLGGAIEGAVEGTEDLLKAQINSYTERKKGLEDFRDSLEEYANAVGGENPLVFVIDELDRCRPSYAVEILEQIKHVFSVPGIVFVLAIDKIQLGHAIKGVYGSPEMDDVEYLRRFIDVEFSLPVPGLEEYSNYLFEYFDFQRTLQSIHNRKKSNEFGRHIRSYLHHFSSYFNLNLRQIEKVCAHLKISFSAIEPNAEIIPTVYLVLVILRIKIPDLYFKLKERSIGEQELVDELSKIIPSNNQMKERGRTVLTLSFLYNNELKYFNPNSQALIELNDLTEETLRLDYTNLGSDRRMDLEFIKLLTESFYAGSLRMSHLISIMELSSKYTAE